MSKLLVAVRRATTRRQTAEREYREAIEAARAEHLLREIADAAGIGIPGVRYLLKHDEWKARDDQA